MIRRLLAWALAAALAFGPAYAKGPVQAPHAPHKSIKRGLTFGSDLSPLDGAYSLINTTIIANGRGAITGPVLNAALNSFEPVFNAMGSFNTVTGAFTPNIPLGAIIAGLGYTPLNKAGDTMTGGLNEIVSGPTWASPPAGITDLNRFVINSFPIGKEFGSETVSTYNPFVLATAVPSTSLFYQIDNFSSYIDSADNNVNTSSVNYFAQFTSSGPNQGGDAYNAVMTNSPYQTSGANTGYDVANMVGFEIDFNHHNDIGGGASSTNEYGNLCGGAADGQPIGAFVCFDVGGTVQGVPLKVAYNTRAGAAAIALDIGAASLSTNSASQPIYMHATSSAGLDIAEEKVINSGGAVLDYAASVGASFLFLDSAGTTIAQLSPSFATFGGALSAPTLTASTDVAGLYYGNTVVNYATLNAQRPCNAANKSKQGYISDGSGSTYLAAQTGGGSIGISVRCNGTQYVNE